MRTQRLYSTEGFTEKPEVEALMRPYLAYDLGPDYKRFHVPADALDKLCALLPEEQMSDRQNNAPSLAEMRKLAGMFPRLKFFVYQIGSQREDERFTCEGFYGPEREMNEAGWWLHHNDPETWPPDEMAPDRFWWD